MVLAGFLLPVAILYFVSGALYTLDIKGHIKKKVITLRLEQPFTPNLERLKQITEKALLERNLPLPNDEPLLRKRRGAYELRWDDMAHVVILTPGRDAFTANLTLKERSTLTQIMRIHRAEAGIVFKALAIIMAVGLIMLFATGIYMALVIHRLRRPLLIAIVGGIVTFLTLLVL